MITYTFRWPSGVQVTETFCPFGSAYSLVTPGGEHQFHTFDDRPVVEDSFADMLATLKMS
jgi:hypothetical protein